MRASLQVERPTLRSLRPHLSADYAGTPDPEHYRATVTVGVMIPGEGLDPIWGLWITFSLSRREDRWLDYVLPDRRTGCKKGWFTRR